MMASFLERKLHMTIQWYPGHMAKARREFQEKLKLVDIVFELVDARIPESSQNPDLQKLIGDKPRIILLTKIDLADPVLTKKWIDEYRLRGIPAVAIDARSGNGIKEVIRKAKDVLADKFEIRRSKGMKPQAIRAVTVGIPNVGKSTVINRLARKKATQVGNKPGVTKAQQWIKYGKELELLDTPGILWPKFEDPEVGEKLALTGAIKDQLLHMDEIALFGMHQLQTYYPGAITSRYHLTPLEEQIEDLPELLMCISEKRGFGNDYERASEAFIFDLRSGKLGRFTFDRVPDSAKGEKSDE